MGHGAGSLHGALMWQEGQGAGARALRGYERGQLNRIEDEAEEEEISEEPGDPCADAPAAA